MSVQFSLLYFRTLMLPSALLHHHTLNPPFFLCLTTFIETLDLHSLDAEPGLCFGGLPCLDLGLVLIWRFLVSIWGDGGLEGSGLTCFDLGLVLIRGFLVSIWGDGCLVGWKLCLELPCFDLKLVLIWGG